MFNSNNKPTMINGGEVIQMNIPLRFMDWRIAAIVLVLYLLMSYFIYVYYYNVIYNSLFSTFFLIGLFLFDQNKILIDHEKVQIGNTILTSVIIPKYNITGIKVVDNDSYKLKKFVNIVLFFTLFSVVLLNVLTIYDEMIHNSIALEKIEESTAFAISQTFFLIFIFYNSHRISHYPKIIKVYAGKKEIVIYPRNEVEFNSLKEKLSIVI